MTASRLIILAVLSLTGCGRTFQNEEAYRQKNNAEYVRHHNCRKASYWPEGAYFDPKKKMIVRLPGEQDYICDGDVFVTIHDDEAQP
jgi:hypothetical protein